MQDVVLEAARFLQARATEQVRLRDVADHVGYSPFHVARAFEQTIGVPPGQFLAAHRFQHAKQLLLGGDDKVVDVCVAVGFTSVGTFTSRFSEAVGLTPTAFRRLPDLLAERPPRPVRTPGAAPDGSMVVGSVHLSAAALAVLGGAAAVYVGLFPRRAARGLPVAGCLLDESGSFMLVSVPPGSYWLLGAALSTSADAPGQLVPVDSVTGALPQPVDVPARPTVLAHDLQLDVVPRWAPPVLVALPALAVPPPSPHRVALQARVLRGSGSTSSEGPAAEMSSSRARA